MYLRKTPPPVIGGLMGCGGSLCRLDVSQTGAAENSLRSVDKDQANSQSPRSSAEESKEKACMI